MRAGTYEITKRGDRLWTRGTDYNDRGERFEYRADTDEYYQVTGRGWERLRGDSRLEADAALEAARGTAAGGWRP